MGLGDGDQCRTKDCESGDAFSGAARVGVGVLGVVECVCTCALDSCYVLSTAG